MKNTAIRRREHRILYAPRGFTLIEAVISMVVIAIIILPSVATIQTSRVRARSIGINLIAQNLAVAMMESVKRSGYNAIAFGQDMPDILDTSSVPSPLLDFPRSTNPGEPPSAENLPAGPPGDVSDADMIQFLNAYRNGTASSDDAAITSDVNYLFFSPDQVAALNGLTPEEVEPETSLLDPRLAWSVYVTDGDPAGDIGGGLPNTGVKHIAIVVKWTDPGRNRVDFTVLESFVAEVAPRM